MFSIKKYIILIDKGGFFMAIVFCLQKVISNFKKRAGLGSFPFESSASYMIKNIIVLSCPFYFLIETLRGEILISSDKSSYFRVSVSLFPCSL